MIYGKKSNFCDASGFRTITLFDSIANVLEKILQDRIKLKQKTIKWIP